MHKNATAVLGLATAAVMVVGVSPFCDMAQDSDCPFTDKEREEIHEAHTTIERIAEQVAERCRAVLGIGPNGELVS